VDLVRCHHRKVLPEYQALRRHRLEAGQYSRVNVQKNQLHCGFMAAGCTVSTRKSHEKSRHGGGRRCRLRGRDRGKHTLHVWTSGLRGKDHTIIRNHRFLAGIQRRASELFGSSAGRVASPRRADRFAAKRRLRYCTRNLASLCQHPDGAGKTQRSRDCQAGLKHGSSRSAKAGCRATGDSTGGP